MRHRCLAVLVACAVFAVAPTRAQDASAEARLREVLRATTIELRALQDGEAALTAQLDQAKRERDALKQQLEAARNAPPVADPQVAQLRDAVAALQQQNGALQTGLQKWQTGYQQAADLARAKDSESRQLGGRLTQQSSRLEACAAANGKLIAEANDILHLYRTQSFRSLLVGSYEPLLGFKKVELENLVQDYEDKIEDQRLQPIEQPPAPHGAGSP
jgi:chromosome segregation ATPase